MARILPAPKAVQESMIKSYLSGATMKEAATPFGYSYGACLRTLRRHGISARSKSIARRRYTLDESYFDFIDTEAKAYWLGFLTADAGIVRTSIVLTLGGCDEGHLLKFQRAVSAQHKVTLFQKGDHSYANIRITSKRLTLALARLGVRERKSLVIKPCASLPHSLFRHYWRGVVDGDGWICPAGRGRWTVGLSGSLAICQGFHGFILTHACSQARVRPHGRIFTVTFTGTNLARCVASILYDHAQIFLDRKIEQAATLLSVPQRN